MCLFAYLSECVSVCLLPANSSTAILTGPFKASVYSTLPWSPGTGVFLPWLFYVYLFSLS